jgi:protein SCO1/2
MIRAHDPLEALRRFFVGGAFPVFVLCLLALYELLLVGLLLVPPGGDGLGAFAEEFRVWCLGYDPVTGRTDWSYAVAMIAPQFLVATTVLLFWWKPLRQTLARPRQLLLPAGAAALLVGAAAAGLTLSGAAAPRSGEFPFPAEDLRIALRAPELALTNQDGDPVELAALRGKVVLLTAMYATCGHTCPLLLAQSKLAVGELSAAEREDLRVVAVTLDPEHDSTEVLANLSRMQEMPAPLYHLVTGEPAEVERVLDRMAIARRRDPETGVIDHAGVFLLVDRQGRVAYRLGLGPSQERWLTAALRVLLQEPPEAG